MRDNKKTIHFFTVLAFLLLNTLYLGLNTAKAQAANSSPYSRYGVGDINTRSFGQGFAMGGASIALQNDTIPMFFINNSNPASYSNFRYTVAELGANYNRVTLQNADTKKTLNNASLGYISLAFPFKKYWGGSFGLIPFSSVGYKVADHQEITNIGGVDYLYEGTGGVNQVYLGTGFKPMYGLPRMFLHSSKYAALHSIKNKTCQEIYHDQMKIKKTMARKKSAQALSFGGNISYLFGDIDNTRRSIFPGTTFFNTKTSTVTRFSDVYFDYGMQWSYTFDSVKTKNPVAADTCRPYIWKARKDKIKIMFGATFAAQTNVHAKMDSLSVNYFTSSTGYEIVKDTVEYVEGHKGTVTLPMSFGVGIGVKKGERWLVAADFAMQNWSSYQAFNQTQGLKNSMRVSLGTQFIPNANAKDVKGVDNYLLRAHYRLGVRYSQTALELKNSRLTEYAVTLGVGFPVGPRNKFQSGNYSMVNIGFEFGERGTITNGLIKEQFLRATLGFTINDRWFVKPKYD